MYLASQSIGNAFAELTNSSLESIEIYSLIKRYNNNREINKFFHMLKINN